MPIYDLSRADEAMIAHALGVANCLETLDRFKPTDLVTYSFDANDTLVLEIQKAAETLGLTPNEALSFMVGVGLGVAHDEGLIGERAVPLQRGELLLLVAHKIVGDPSSTPDDPGR